MNQLPLYQHEIRPLSRLQKIQLLGDLKQQRVAHRKQGRESLSYLEAWDVRAMLIRIFGFGGFSTRVVASQFVHEDHTVPATVYKQGGSAGDPKEQRMDRLIVGGQMTEKPAFNWRITASATVELYIHQLGAVYTEIAVASQVGPDHGDVADFAMKTAESDALKRGAINLGTQFGLSLYNNGELGDVVRGLLNEGETMVTGQSIRASEAQLPVAVAVAQPTSAPQADEQGVVADDAPMALAPSPEAHSAAQAQVAGAFGG